MKHLRLIAEVVLLALTTVMPALPANAQNGGTAKKAAAPKFYWCWAATLRPDTRYGSPGKNKAWYSTVFSGDFPTGNVNTGFRAFIGKNYNDDVMATGVGPGECGSYASRAAAESSKNQNVIWRRDDNGFNIVDTAWSYGTNLWECRILTNGMVDEELTLSLYPDGTPATAGEAVWGYLKTPVYSKGSREHDTWYREPDGTLVVSIYFVNEVVDTFYMRLMGGKLAGYFDSSDSRNKHTPISCERW
jgi:hypothetical protein